MGFESVFRKIGVVIIEHALDKSADLAAMDKAFAVRPRFKSADGSLLQDMPLAPDLADWLETHPALIDLASRLLAAPARLTDITINEGAPSGSILSPWHQRRRITVAERHRVRGYRGWTEDGHVWLVEPPAWVLEQTVVLRVYLDPCNAQSGPLEVATKTHQHGVMKRQDVLRRAKAARNVTCLCERGDVLALAPLAARRQHRSLLRRRVRSLDLTFSAAVLPPPLEWASLTPDIEREMVIWSELHV